MIIALNGKTCWNLFFQLPVYRENRSKQWSTWKIPQLQLNRTVCFYSAVMSQTAPLIWVCSVCRALSIQYLEGLRYVGSPPNCMKNLIVEILTKSLSVYHRDYFLFNFACNNSHNKLHDNSISSPTIDFLSGCPSFNLSLRCFPNFAHKRICWRHYIAWITRDFKRDYGQ